MQTLREWIRRFWGTFRQNPLDRELEDELRLHLELAGENARQCGCSPEDARRAALVEAGGITQVMDALRDQRGLPWMDDLARDVRYGLRSLRRSPAFTAVALLTLALGIGANTAIFSIVNGVILRPLPYPKPEQLMHLNTQAPAIGLMRFPLSAPEYLEFRKINQSFAAVGAYQIGEANITGADSALRVRAAFVDDHLLNALGVQPAQGRLFSPGETDISGSAAPGQPAPPLPPVAILSHELWQAAFGGQRMVGQMVELTGRRPEVIGIMPPGADVLDNRIQIWLPLGLNPANPGDRRNHRLYLIGRLKDGVTAQAAQTELNALIQNWGERVAVTDHVFAPVKTDRVAQGVNFDAGHILQMKPLHGEIVGDAGLSIWVLQAAVGLVLLIGCANLANLLLARAETRHREFAVRAALGASRSRLLRQSVIEGVLLSIAGGALGVLLAHGGVQALIRVYPTSLPRTSEVTLDPLVLLFTIGVSMVTGVVFGLAPVMRTGSGLMTALKEGGTKGGTVTASHYTRLGLVVAEVALAVMLVFGAGLLLRTVYNLTNVDAGFNRSRLVTFLVPLPFVNYPQPAARVQIYQRLLDTLRAVPGVQSATAMSGLPPNRPAINNNTDIESYIAPPGGPFELVEYEQFVMPDYFETMGIPIVQGRSFQATDAVSSGMVAIVNETFLNTFLKGRNPIGQRVRPCCGDRMPWFTVVGVAKDVKQGGVHQKTGTELYFFAAQAANLPPPRGSITPGGMNVVLRTTLPAAVLSPTIERAVREVDRSVPVVRLRDMEGVFAESIQRPRLLAQLVGGFAGLALLLAAIGTYGVLSYLIAERRREIGIRVALGATRSSVLAMMMKHGLQLTMIGIVVGLAGALALNRVLASLLFGVRPTDPTTIIAVVGTIATVAAVACGLPAFRASRLDPNVVLRDE
jgi:predicted permease